ncbi:E3 ubiquitin-protein ligase RNF146 [Glossina fuscipes]|uniref:E3 ubiquitin-protein ligase n=1 Tax=Glossina fuscipes TaxID=7396 RepID=A0A9C5ZP52_9MUSC|nr:E3 ubiquitin-protein ligase RNF146 [Glossina fuscipes]XP_037900850.1 E3 ubiquitin-protein ligase RNF146 [Glossina fuscipes]
MDNLEDNLTATESSVLSNSNDVLVNHRDVAVTLDQPIDLASSHITALSANETTTNITPTLQTSTFSAGTESPDKNATKSNKTPLDVPSTSAAAAAALANDSASALNKDTSGTEPSAPANVLECPICLQTCIHPARLPCGHIFCFLCVKGVAYKNRRCAMCRREIPGEFLNHPQLVNGIEDICSTRATEDGYQWFYEGRNGWWQYDDRTSQDIEEAYKKGEKSCTILVAGYVYIVDLETMIQQRQNEPSRCRHVKRDLATIPKKGVAGLRIEGNSVITNSNFASQLYNQNRQQQNIGNAINGHPDIDLRLPLDYVSRLSRDGLNTNAGISNDFVSTTAVTDAAIRIASNIIGSTLAHADELTRPRSLNNISVFPSTPTIATRAGIDNSMDELDFHDLSVRSGVAGSINSTTNYSIVSTPVSTLSNNHRLLSATGNEAAAVFGRGNRELFVAAENLLGTTQQIMATADQPTIDLTINNFHALTLHDLVDSVDDNEDNDGNDLNNRTEHNLEHNNSVDETENISLLQRNRRIIDDNTENSGDGAENNIFHVRQLRF